MAENVPAPSVSTAQLAGCPADAGLAGAAEAQQITTNSGLPDHALAQSPPSAATDDDSDHLRSASSSPLSSPPHWAAYSSDSSASNEDTDKRARSTPPPPSLARPPYEAPYVRLDRATATLADFEDAWERGCLIVVHGIQPREDWTGAAFVQQYGNKKVDVVDCRTLREFPYSVSKFFNGFHDAAQRKRDEDGRPMTLKLKDWPSDADFKDVFPDHFADLMNILPFPEYTNRLGKFNLVRYLPAEFGPPDLGPKMYNAYAASPLEESSRKGAIGTTCLHLDMSDAVNLMVHVGGPELVGATNDMGDRPDGQAASRRTPGLTTPTKKRKREDDATLEDAGETDRRRAKMTATPDTQAPSSPPPPASSPPPPPPVGAIWDVWAAKDRPKLRAFLKQRTESRGLFYADVIHDQAIYVTDEERALLYAEHGVRGWRVYQRPGDAVFVPAGCAHQVANTRSAIKVAMDFVSPQHVQHSAEITQEFRNLPNHHRRKPDLLQLDNILLAAWKAATA